MFASIRLIKQNTKRRHLAKQLQAMLAVLNYPIGVDGAFGPNTVKNVKQFQQDKELSADGVVGKTTWLALYHATAGCLSQLCYDKPLADKEKEIFGTDQTLFTELDPKADAPNSVHWLQALMQLVNDNTEVNGQYDNATQSFVNSVKAECGMDTDSCVDDATWVEIFQAGLLATNRVVPLFLTNDMIAQVAKEEDLEPAAIKAVIKVESRGTGFYEDKRPVILFEGHKFWEDLEKQGIAPAKLRKGNEDILYPKWTKSHYVGTAAGEYDRLQRAKKINKDAALRSASWGMFQIMGFNHKPSGFGDVESFVSNMKASEYDQIKAFIKFLHSEKIYPYLKKKDWAGFARRYNGKLFKKNGYDSKLQIAYNANATIGTRGEDPVEFVINEYHSQYVDAFEEALQEDK